MRVESEEALPQREVFVCFDFEGQWGMPYRAPYDVEGATEAILACLARHRARGTFFVVGALALERPKLVREIARGRHQIALHGWRHEHLGRLSPAELAQAGSGLRESEDMIESLTGTRPVGFRAPYLLGPAFFDPNVYELLEAHGYRWTSNREIRHPVELLRPDRIRTERPWHLAETRPETLRGPRADTIRMALNANYLRRDPVGGSLTSSFRWLVAGAAPFYRGRLLEIPLYGPLDCDLVGLPAPTEPTPEPLMEYARFALRATVTGSAGFTMLTFHDWIISASNRIELLDGILASLDRLSARTATVSDAWPGLVRLATPDSRSSCLDS